MNYPAQHHLDEATLLSFSAGTLNQALAALVATHVSSCRHCADEQDKMDLLGATLLASLPVPIQGDHASPTISVRETPARANTTAPTVAEAATGILPEILRRHFDISENGVRWRQLAPGVWHYPLKISGEKAGDLRLLKIAPGCRMLEHGHGGTELTLVLQGAFSDSTGEYLPGDIQEVGEEIEHAPVADKVSGCICLIASEERARFRGLLGKMVQAWTGL